jgi:hypothetical protein
MQDWLNPRYNGLEILQTSLQDMRFSACW